MRDRKSFVNVIRFFGQLRNLEKGRPLVFLDETWANAHISKERIWLDDSGKNGWIPGASLVFRRKAVVIAPMK